MWKRKKQELLPPEAIITKDEVKAFSDHIGFGQYRNSNHQIDFGTTYGYRKPGYYIDGHTHIHTISTDNDHQLRQSAEIDRLNKALVVAEMQIAELEKKLKEEQERMIEI